MIHVNLSRRSGYQVCSKCVMDTSDPDITFDENNVCSHCYAAEENKKKYPFNLKKEERQNELERKIKKIRTEGEGKQYDCVIGLSGGVDSSYLAYLVKKKWNLRPIAIHLDNGWDSELSVHNIELLCKKLGIDLYTYVINWEEFRDLQVAFLKASTPDSEIPTDHAIFALWRKMPIKFGAKFFLTGQNSATEQYGVPAWSYGHNDWRYIKSVHRKFGTISLKSFPHFSKLDLVYWHYIKGIRIYNPLDFIEYNKEEAKETLYTEIGWRSYGEKHYESLYTKFFQAYILPEKFGFDKRRMHLSSLIQSGQITREQALEDLKKPLYKTDELRQDLEYFLNNIRLSKTEFKQIMESSPKHFSEYSSNETYLPYIIIGSIWQKWVYRLIKPWIYRLRKHRS